VCVFIDCVWCVADSGKMFSELKDIDQVSVILFVCVRVCVCQLCVHASVLYVVHPCVLL